MKPTILLACILFLLCELSACAGKQNGVLSDAQISENAKSPTIQVTWLVPGEAVERYHVHYGYDPENLTETLVVPIDVIDKVDDETLGPLYTLSLKVPESKDKKDTLFVALESEHKDVLSHRCEPMAFPLEDAVDIEGAEED